MINQPSDPRHGREAYDIVATRRSVSERLSDPYLTDHDRWVLRQFGRFLSGVAPEPDPRVVRIDSRQQLQRSRVPARYR